MEKEEKKCKCHNLFDDTILFELSSLMEKNGYLKKEDIASVAKKTSKSEAEVFGVATFYSQFSFEKPAKYNIVVCTGTACFVLGGDDILKALERYLGIKSGEITANGKFSLASARCFGCCAQAPVFSINGKIYGKMSASKAVAIVKEIDDENNQ